MSAKPSLLQCEQSHLPPSFFSHKRYSNALISFKAFFGPTLKGPHHSYAENSSTGHNIPREGSVEQNRGAESPPPVCRLQFFWDRIIFLGCKSTLLTYNRFYIHPHPQVLLLKAALNPLTFQFVLIPVCCPNTGVRPCTWPC